MTNEELKALSLFTDDTRYTDDYTQIVPSHTELAIDEYVLIGFRPGSFLYGVLSNDLHQAVIHADYINENYIIPIVKWIHQHAPPQSFGSPEIVDNWINDTDNVRSNWFKEYGKQVMWRNLNKK